MTPKWLNRTLTKHVHQRHNDFSRNKVKTFSPYHTNRNKIELPRKSGMKINIFCWYFMLSALLYVSTSTEQHIQYINGKTIDFMGTRNLCCVCASVIYTVVAWCSKSFPRSKTTNEENGVAYLIAFIHNKPNAKQKSEKNPSIRLILLWHEHLHSAHSKRLNSHKNRMFFRSPAIAIRVYFYCVSNMIFSLQSSLMFVEPELI